jgi:hypothetical protein
MRAQAHAADQQGFRFHALQCLSLAELTQNLEAKGALIKMAQEWTALAEGNDRKNAKD